MEDEGEDEDEEMDEFENSDDYDDFDDSDDEMESSEGFQGQNKGRKIDNNQIILDDDWMKLMKCISVSHSSYDKLEKYGKYDQY